MINKTEGFFVECGAADGESGSNTLYMERTLKWKGVLIEANRKFFSKLLSKKRSSYALPVCLSLEPYATEVGELEPSTFSIVKRLNVYHYCVFL